MILSYVAMAVYEKTISGLMHSILLELIMQLLVFM